MKNGAKSVTSADLTENAILLTKKRAEIYRYEIETSLENAEKLTFEDSKFTHVNCQGVIHHTPDTNVCVREIARVLEPDGTALISVYYKNFFLRSWPILRYFGKLFSMLGAGLKGRGRERIYESSQIDEIVRLYDGAENPIGKAYSKKEFQEMLSEEFEVQEFFLHFFPARSLPFRIPRRLHAFLDSRFGFLIFARCKKKPQFKPSSSLGSN